MPAPHRRAQLRPPPDCAYRLDDMLSGRWDRLDQGLKPADHRLAAKVLK